MSPVFVAFARLLPVVFFSGLGVYFMQSNVAAGLGLALKSADVFVTVALTGMGWAVTRFLSSVDKRFDAIDIRFDANDQRFNTTDSNLREVKILLEQLQHSSSAWAADRFLER